MKIFTHFLRYNRWRITVVPSRLVYKFENPPGENPPDELPKEPPDWKKFEEWNTDRFKAKYKEQKKDLKIILSEADINDPQIRKAVEDAKEELDEIGSIEELQKPEQIKEHLDVINKIIEYFDKIKKLEELKDQFGIDEGKMESSFIAADIPGLKEKVDEKKISPQKEKDILAKLEGILDENGINKIKENIANRNAKLDEAYIDANVFLNASVLLEDYLADSSMLDRQIDALNNITSIADTSQVERYGIIAIESAKDVEKAQKRIDKDIEKLHLKIDEKYEEKEKGNAEKEIINQTGQEFKDKLQTLDENGRSALFAEWIGKYRSISHKISTGKEGTYTETVDAVKKMVEKEEARAELEELIEMRGGKVPPTVVALKKEAGEEEIAGEKVIDKASEEEMTPWGRRMAEIRRKEFTEKGLDEDLHKKISLSTYDFVRNDHLLKYLDIIIDPNNEEYSEELKKNAIIAKERIKEETWDTAILKVKDFVAVVQDKAITDEIVKMWDIVGEYEDLIEVEVEGVKLFSKDEKSTVMTKARSAAEKKAGAPETMAVAVEKGVAIGEANDQQKEDAGEAFRVAQDNFDAQYYGEALEGFRKSYALVASPNTHWMIVRLLVKLDKKDEALAEARIVIDEAREAAKTDSKYNETVGAAEEEVKYLIAIIDAQAKNKKEGEEGKEAAEGAVKVA